MSPAARRHLPEPASDSAGVEEHGRDEHERGPVVHRVGQPLGDRLHRLLGDPDHLQALLGEPVELAANGVELAIGRDQPGPGAQGERRQQPHDQLVSIGRERDPVARIAEQPGESLAHPLGALEGMVPLVVDVAGSVEPRLGLGLEAAVGPGLVRVPGEQQPLGDAEAGVVGRERVGRAMQRRRVHHSSVRMAQRSGKSGLLSVVMRYSAPVLSPVPRFVPIVRCTIFTCR